jgi:hypothetical protein
MKLENEIALAVERLYEVFLPYKRRDKVDGCPCCVKEEQVRKLCGMPLHQMTSEHFTTYPFKAMTTWGDTLDFKHFLPRILELAFKNEINYGIDEIIQKMVYADWVNWRQEERQAIEDFLLLGFQYHSKHTGMHPDYWWEGCNYEKFLNLWEISLDDYSFYYFADLVTATFNRLYKGTEKSYRYKYVPDYVLLEWMANKKELIFNMFLEHEKQNPQLACEIADCYDYLVACEKIYNEF